MNLGSARPMLGLALLTLALQVSAQDEAMQQGIAAFGAGRYQEALTHFENARAGGEASLTLRYNLGATLYRLGRYAEARAQFLPLLEQEQWRTLATYNLALVAEAMGDAPLARQYYTLAAQQETEVRIRDLARTRLAQLDRTSQPGGAPAAAARRWQGLATLGGGHDSNATSLTEELLNANANGEDHYLEAMLYGQGYLQGQASQGTRLHGLWFERAFDEFDYLDTRVLGAGITHERPLGPLRGEVFFTLTGSWLDAALVNTQSQLGIGASWDGAPGTWGARYAYADVAAGDDYPQTDGDQHRLELSWQRGVGPVTLGARYRHERNDRADLSLNGGFASYSPVRDQWQLNAVWRLDAALDASLGYEYTDSDYRGVNILRDVDGATVTAQRHNTFTRTWLGLRYRFDPRWSLSAQYEYSDSDDTFALYRYDKERLGATVEFAF